MSNNGHDDKNPWGKINKGKNKDDSNVVSFRGEVKRKKKEEKKQARAAEKLKHGPLINLPPITKYFLGSLIAIHLIVFLLLSANAQAWLFTHFGFIPGRFTGAALFEPLQFLTPLTHIFFHGSWLHIGMNGAMLLAFGSGAEKTIGGKKMLIIFAISSVFGVTAHFALNWDSIYPVIGASGGLSGLFAVMIVILNRQNKLGGKYGVWPFIALWIGISVLFGMMGSPDGGDIAWAAHIGGFLGGFVAIKLLKL